MMLSYGDISRYRSDYLKKYPKIKRSGMPKHISDSLEKHIRLTNPISVEDAYPESIKVKRRLDGLQERLLDMVDDVHELQQDIQFVYRNVEKIYEIIEEDDEHEG